MKKSVLLIIITAGFFSSKQSNKSTSGTVNAETSNSAKSVHYNNFIYSQYEYSDTMGKRLIIQNGFPKGGSRYTDLNGEVYGYAVFWTRIINETDNPLELKINFSDSYEVPSLPGKHFKLVVPPDTITLDKEGLFNHGLTNLDSFLDYSIHKPSSLKRTINPKESNGFYIVKLSPVNEGVRGGGDILRTGLILKGQDLFYKILVYNDMSPPSIRSEKEINCGSINLKNLVLQQ